MISGIVDDFGERAFEVWTEHPRALIGLQPIVSEHRLDIIEDVLHTADIEMVDARVVIVVIVLTEVHNEIERDNLSQLVVEDNHRIWIEI